MGAGRYTSRTAPHAAVATGALALTTGVVVQAFVFDDGGLAALGTAFSSVAAAGGRILAR